MSEIDALISKHWGGSSKEAQAALGVSKQAISQWRARGIPELRRYQINAILQATGKALPDSPTERPVSLPS